MEEERGQVPVSVIEKHYRGYVFLGLSAFSGVMLVGRLFRYEAWRQTGGSLLFLMLLGAVVWGVIGYARLSSNRGGHLYGHQQKLAIVVCAVPAVILFLLVLLAFSL